MLILLLCFVSNISLVSISLAENSALNAARLDLALQEVQYGRFKEAADIWQEMSAEGNAQAQFSLATSYQRGQGRVKDISQAQTLFLQSAKSGYLRAMHHLGLLYMLEENAAEKIKNAIVWWQKASDESFAESQYHLGVAYFIGLGVEKNNLLAMKWLEAAQVNGYAENGFVLEMMQRKQQLNLLEEPNIINFNAEKIINTPKQVLHLDKKSGIQVFPSPSTNHQPFTVVKDVSQIRVVKRQGDWLQIENKSHFALWVFGKFVATHDDVSTITGDSVRLRVSPNTKTNVPPVDNLNKGDQVQILEVNGGWLKVKAPIKIKAWIQAKALVAENQQ